MELADLSPLAKTAAQAKAITGEWEYPAFDQLLQELIAYDNTIDARVKRRRKWMMISIVLSFVLLLATFFLADTDYFYFVVASFGAAVAYMILCIQLWRKSKKLALPEASLEMVHQLARLLRQDLDPKAKISITIDLSGPTDQKKTASNKPKQWIYLDPWCAMRFKLRDGYIAVVRQTDTFTKTIKTKKGAGGKTKSKTKWKKQCRVTARIIPPTPVVWGASPQVDPVWERHKMVTKNDVSVAVLDRWWAFKQRTDVPTKSPAAKDIIGMLFRLSAMRPLEAK